MKYTFTLLAAVLLTSQLFGQLRITEVDPLNDSFIIKNFGSTTVDISSHQACARFSYSVLSGFGLLSGSLVLAPDAEVELQGVGYLNDVSSDLGLYQPSPTFNNPAHMIDFLQYGGSGIGRESVAAAKGIWVAGTFITGAIPYSYTCSGEQLGVGAWVPAGTTYTTQLRASDCGSTVGTMTQYIKADALSNTSRYMWEADNGITADTNYSPLTNPSSRVMAMSFFDNAAYNVTYNMRVKTYRNGCWSDWGNICTVTTPAAAPTTQLVAGDCGTTLTSNFSYLRYGYIAGATRYRIWATDGAIFSDTIYTPYNHPTLRRFYMAQFNNISLSTTYQVRVAALVGGSWQAFGPLCNVTTAASKSAADNHLIAFDAPMAESLQVWPNPSSSTIFVSLPGLTPGEHNAHISVFDLTGRRVWSRQLVSTETELLGQLNTDGQFAPGVYLLVANIDDQVYQQKVVVQ